MMARKLDTKLSCCDGSRKCVGAECTQNILQKNPRYYAINLLISETTAKLSAYLHPQRPKMQEFGPPKVASSIFPFFPGTFRQE